MCCCNLIEPPTNRWAHKCNERCRDAIRQGRIANGERLPSSRILARDLGVSRGLVVDCYSQLRCEGFLAARAGSATIVAIGAIGAIDLPAPPPTTRAGGAVRVDFAYGEPDLHRFPMKDWLWSLAEAARTMPISSLGYGDAGCRRGAHRAGVVPSSRPRQPR